MTWYHNVEDSSLSASVTSFFSGDWGIWLLLVLYNMASIFIYARWIWTLHWERYLTSTDFIYCDAHLYLLIWMWILVCDWDIWFPSCTFVAGDSALHGFLVISSKFFVLVLLEIVWCRAELSALHHASRCWNFVLAERDVLENELEVWGSFANQKNIVQNICNHLLRSWV